MQSCRELQGYMMYVERVRAYARQMPMEDAVERAVDECIAEDILADFLRQNRAEVVMRVLYEYDQEEHYRMIAEEEKKYGREEGRAEGRAEAVLELLSDVGDVPGELEQQIREEKSIEVLKKWLKLAAKSENLDGFLRQM